MGKHQMIRDIADVSDALATFAGILSRFGAEAPRGGHSKSRGAAADAAPGGGDVERPKPGRDPIRRRDA